MGIILRTVVHSCQDQRANCYAAALLLSSPLLGYLLTRMPLQVNAYPVPRMRLYQLFYAAAQANDYAAMLPWQLLPWHVDPANSGGYDYGTDDPTYLGPIVQAQNYQSARVRTLAGR